MFCLPHPLPIPIRWMWCWRWWSDLECFWKLGRKSAWMKRHWWYFKAMRMADGNLFVDCIDGVAQCRWHWWWCWGHVGSRNTHQLFISSFTLIGRANRFHSLFNSSSNTMHRLWPTPTPSSPSLHFNQSKIGRIRAPTPNAHGDSWRVGRWAFRNF